MPHATTRLIPDDADALAMGARCVRTTLLAAILLLAIVVRFANLAEPSIWFDEARTFHGAKPGADLIDGLLHGGYSVGPLGMIHFRLAIALSDGGEWWLRVPSALAGLAVVYFLWVLGLRYGGIAVGAVAGFGGAIADGFIRYSREFRHYSMEMFLTMALLCLAEQIIRSLRDGESGARWKAAYLLVAFVSSFYSWAPVFVIVLTASWLVLEHWRRKGWPGAARMVLLHVPAGVLFAILYIVIARSQASSGGYHDFWAAFMYGGSNTASFWKWASNNTAGMCDLAFGSIPWYAVMALSLLGIERLIRAGEPLRIIPLLGCPLLLMVLGALRLYPYGARPGMYAMGPWMLLMALGAGGIFNAMFRAGFRVSVSVAASVVVAILGYGAVRATAIQPRLWDHLRPLYQRLVAEYRPGDLVCVHFRGIPTFEYYNRKGTLPVHWRLRPQDIPPFVQNVRELTSDDARVWLVFCHFQKGEIPDVPNRIIETAGLLMRDRWTAPLAEVWKLTRTQAGLEIASLDPLRWSPVKLRGGESPGTSRLDLPLESTGGWAYRELPLPAGWRAGPDTTVDVTFELTTPPATLDEVTVILNSDRPRTYLWSPQSTAPKDGRIRIRTTLAEMSGIREDSPEDTARFPYERLRMLTVRCGARPGQRAEAIVRHVILSAPEAGETK